MHTSTDVPSHPTQPQPLDDADPVPALRLRIAAARVLREHLVWEALRVLPALANVRETHDAFARFRQLMEQDDLDSAVLLLAASAAPPRALLDQALVDGIWTCRLTTETAPRCRRIHAAHHPDRPASLLAALVASDDINA
ncbi:hypothetical protein [Rhizobium sp. GN54]|uniref:hypothetical protein n=1 Tax=Rhizobium sp. GN54 TaxID=2898150 RepID=UPI001E49237B|nr:hypothetical protein [Rhizobium sp. GN54]MCD2181451.1 hypothetical protein [Rhizobium sp. GN54]